MYNVLISLPEMGNDIFLFLANFKTCNPQFSLQCHSVMLIYWSDMIEWTIMLIGLNDYLEQKHFFKILFFSEPHKLNVISLVEVKQ